ncbi:ABC transporter permease subunit [Paraburkholderia bannensis]|uniref:ABC transporter permease subunit n=1 Tax=Paraburkholderia bannensis TaxID=765414 RepID=UPI002AC35142|nr:ABC transporter permease subunit [Paraburkholderia bannensis]
MTDMTATIDCRGSDKPVSAYRLKRYIWQSPIFLWLLILVFLPNLLLLGVSFLKSGDTGIVWSFTLNNYIRASQSPGVWRLLIKTILTASVSTGVAAAIAYPMAYYAARTLRRGQFIFVLLVIIPLWISLLMRIFAWRVLLGENGVLNTFLMSVGVISEPSSALLYSNFAVLLTFVYVSIPFIFIAVYSAIERIPHALVEAAGDCGASQGRTFWSIIWPLSKPGFAIGVALSFLMAVGDYVTPSMVGGLDGTMLGMVISSQFGIAGDWPYGAALSVLLLLAVTIVLAIVFKLTRVPGILVGEGGSNVPMRRPRTMTARIRAALAFGAFLLPYVFLYAPLIIIGIFSFNASSVQVFPLTGFSFHWYEDALANPSLIAALERSIYVGSAVLLISVISGTGFAVAFAYSKVAGARWVEQMLALPLAIPGVVLGVTLVLAFGILGLPVGTPRFVLGHATFVMPVVMMTVVGRLRRLDPSLVEASWDLGATNFQTFTHVLIPLVKSAIIGGALLGFTLSFDEVVVSLFLSGSEPTLPIWVWNQMRFGFTPSVNAVFVCIGVFSIALTYTTRKFLGSKSAMGS